MRHLRITQGVYVIKLIKVIFVSLLVSMASQSRTVYDSWLEKKPKFQYVSNQQQNNSGVINDSMLVAAVNQERNINYIEAGNLTVEKLLPDDLSGRPHQKILVRLSNGKSIQIISNLEFCDKAPVSIGDKVSVGGQFIWTRRTGLVHWTHSDPSGQRQKGFLFFNGKDYCQ